MLPLTGLITRGCAPRCSNLPDLLGDPSLTGLFWERQTGLFTGLNSLHTKKQVSVAGYTEEGGELAGRGGVAAARREGWSRMKRMEPKDRNEKKGILRNSLTHVLPPSSHLS